MTEPLLSNKMLGKACGSVMELYRCGSFDTAVAATHSDLIYPPRPTGIPFELEVYTQAKDQGVEKLLASLSVDGEAFLSVEKSKRKISCNRLLEYAHRPPGCTHSLIKSSDSAPNLEIAFIVEDLSLDAVPEEPEPASKTATTIPMPEIPSSSQNAESGPGLPTPKTGDVSSIGQSPSGIVSSGRTKLGRPHSSQVIKISLRPTRSTNGLYSQLLWNNLLEPC